MLKTSGLSPTYHSGKWLLFVPLGRLDKAWRLIADETISGHLGIAAKAATAMDNDLAKNKSIKVICIYTYDANDTEDVMRVRRRLREIGFTKKIPCKTDEATKRGHYSGEGKNRASLFFE